MWWYLGTLFVVIGLVGVYIVIYENRLLYKYDSIEIGSKWVMSFDPAEWNLPEYIGIVTVIGKEEDVNNLIIYCATEDKRVVKYLIEDFLKKGKRI